jgi:hypothetical protein
MGREIESRSGIGWQLKLSVFSRKKMFYFFHQTVLEEYNTLVCQCKEDGCNGAEAVSLSFGLMTVTVALAAFFTH